MRRVFLALWVFFLLLWLPYAHAQPVTATLQAGAASGNGTIMQVSGLSFVAVTVLGTAGADRVVTFQVAQTSGQYVSVMCTNPTTLAKSTTVTATGTTPIVMDCPVAGKTAFRTPISGGATGSLTITATALPNVSQGGGAGGGAIAQSSGTIQNIEPYWNFTGAGVTVTDNPGSNRLDIAISGLGTSGLADPGANGMLARTATGVTTSRTLTGISGDIIITNGTGLSGNPTIGAGANIPRLDAANTFSSISAQSVAQLTLRGSSSGTITFSAPATAGTNTITWPAGTTDFSSTGGSSQVVRQPSLGGAFTVGQLAASDLSNGTTGSGAVVLGTSPTLVTPTLGAATATTINKITLTAPASSATLTIPDGVTLTGPSASATVATLSLTNTFTGRQDASGAASTAPMKVGLVSALPSTCTPGDLYFASDATAGQQIYECSSANIWTQQLNSGGGGGGSGNVSNSGTPTNGQIAQWTNATTIQGLSTTGSGNVVLATSPTITTPTIAKLANLTSNGFVKTSNGDGTLSVDTNTYITGNQTITLSGDLSGSGSTAITTALANSGASAGTYTKVTINAKGLATSGATATLASSDFANQGTTTTLLHGNASGNPSFGAVSLTADVSGVLPAANLPTTTVLAATNDTNVTGTISAQTLTLGWAGTLAKARQNASTVYLDQANTFSGSGAITGLPTPTSASDAATKSYVDNSTSGLSPRTAVRVASTADFASTYNNGSSGVGAFLTATSNGAIAIDGVNLGLNDRLLLKNQSTAARNGIYLVSTVGDVSNPAVITRTTDYDQSAANEVAAGSYVVVTEGTANTGTLWIETGQGPFTIGTTALTFTQLTVAGGGGGGSVTSITFNSPLTGGTITSTGSVGITDAAADGTTKGAATFTAADFNATSGLISIDYTNGQAASSSQKGFLTSADWTTFNNKVSSSTTITIAGTATEITSSAGAQDLSANRTWTLSLPTIMNLSTKTLSGGSPLVFDGATADTNKTTVVVTDPTGARNFTVPDADSVAVQPDTGASNNFLTAISALGVISKAQPSFSNIAGSVASTQMPALTGDTTTSAGTTVTTTSKVNGVSYPATPSTNTVPVVTSSNTITYEAVPNAALANSTITIQGSAIALGGTTLATTSTPRFAALGLGGAAPSGPGVKQYGSTSGSMTLTVAAAVGGDFTITLPGGSTNFADGSTGGPSQVVKQTTAGGAFTVARLACADLSDSGAGCTGTAVTGSGSTNALVKWSSSSAVTTSGIIDNGSVVAFNRGLQRKSSSISANTTIDTTYDMVLVTTGAGGVTVTLPAATGLTGQVYAIQKVDSGAGALTIAPNGTDTINGTNGNVSTTLQHSIYEVVWESSTGWIVTATTRIAAYALYVNDTNGQLTGLAPGSNGTCVVSNGTSWGTGACGTVAISGTPLNGQMAQWTNATTIQGVTRSLTINGTSGRITMSAGTQDLSADRTWTADLATTAVTPASYTNTNLTVDAYGRITAAANGSGGSGTPGGTTGDIQTNVGGAFAADSGNYVYNVASHVQYTQAIVLGAGASIFALNDVAGVSGLQVQNTLTESRTYGWPNASGNVGITSGTLTNGNCAKYDASGRLVDAGAACGVGTIASGTNHQLAFYNGTGTTLGGEAAAGTAGTYLKSNGTDWVVSTGSASGTGSCTNQVVTALSSDAAPTCTTITSAYVNSSILTTAAAVTIGQGGTGQTTATAAFDALSPMTAAGDLIYGGTSGTRTRLATGTAKQILTAGTTPAWISFPDFHYLPSVNCVNAVAGIAWSMGATPTAACRAGTNNTEGYLTWGASDTAEFSIGLPLDWDSATNPSVSLQLASTDTTSGHTVIMQLATACQKGDGTTTDDVSFNTAQSFGTVTLNTTANQAWKTTLSTITMTGCSAGGILRMKLSRTTDTATNVRIYGLGVTIPRLLTVQAN